MLMKIFKVTRTYRGIGGRDSSYGSYRAGGCVTIVDIVVVGVVNDVFVVVVVLIVVGAVADVVWAIVVVDDGVLVFYFLVVNFP